jgi:copper resistance protein B
LLTIAPAAAQDHSAHMPPTVQSAPAPSEADARRDGTPTPATPTDSHAGHDAEMQADMVTPAEPGSGPANAADGFFDPAIMARAREQLRIENGEVMTHAVIFDQLETTFNDNAEGYAWNAQGWYGGDIHRLWWKSEGEGAFDENIEHAELQFLYSRAVTPYFDVQAGLRQIYQPEGDRTDLVIGMQGLAPYWFELDGALFLSNEGELTARAEAEYDLRLTQRLILQPRAEISFSAQDIPEFAIGTGVSNVEAGVRLRYEISRRFAPYAGVEWSGGVGGTRDFIKANGEDPDSTRFVVGVRTWF